MDFVNDVIARKRDGGELDAERIRAFVRRCHDGSVPSYQASALLMAIVLARSERRRDRWNWRGPSSRAARPSTSAPCAGRCSTSTRAAASATRSRSSWLRCRRLRGDLRQDVGAGSGPHGRHARQARVDPGLQGPASPGRVPASARAHRRRRRESERSRRARRPRPLRASRRHRHGAQRWTHRREHHGEEGGGRDLGPRPRPQGGPRRLHGGPAARARTSVASAASSAPPTDGRRPASTPRMDAPLGCAVGNRLEVEEAWRCCAGRGRTTCARLCLPWPRRSCRSPTSASTRRRRGGAPRRRWPRAVPPSTSSAGATCRAGAGSRGSTRALPRTRCERPRAGS